MPTTTQQVETKSLDELLTTLREREEKNRDFLVPASLLTFNGSNSLRAYRRNGQVDEYQPNDLFHDQMANYLGVPKSYYTRLKSALTLEVDTIDDDMRLTKRSLFDVTMNTHLKDKADDMRLLRVQDGTARAFLSDNFNTDLDNYVVALAAAEAMAKLHLPPDAVYRAGVTHEHLHMQVLIPGLKATIPSKPRDAHGYLEGEGDVIEGGFQLTNSEVGLGHLSLSLYVRRLVCLNGATATQVVKKRHVGRILDADDDGQVYTSETRQAEAHTRLLALRDQIQHLIGGQAFGEFIQKMAGATEIAIPKEKPLADVVEVTKKRLSLTEGEQMEVLINLQDSKDFTLYGLGNAVTATARETANADRRLELEAQGGEVFGWRGTQLAGIAR